MFYLYLESLKKKSDDNKILDTINELNNITLRMNEMLNSVGKEILGGDKDEYEKVIHNQLEIMIDFFGDQFRSSIDFERELPDEILDKIDLYEAAKIIYEHALKIEIPVVDGKMSFDKYIKQKEKINQDILAQVQGKLYNLNENLLIKKFNFRMVNEKLREKVLPYIKNQDDEKLLLLKIKNIIESELTPLPF